MDVSRRHRYRGASMGQRSRAYPRGHVRSHPYLRTRARASASPAPLPMRPAWDDSIHDLSKYKLSPQQVLSRKLAALSPHDAHAQALLAAHSLSHAQSFNTSADDSGVLDASPERAWLRRKLGLTADQDVLLVDNHGHTSLALVQRRGEQLDNSAQFMTPPKVTTAQPRPYGRMLAAAAAPAVSSPPIAAPRASSALIHAQTHTRAGDTSFAESTANVAARPHARSRMETLPDTPEASSAAVAAAAAPSTPAQGGKDLLVGVQRVVRGLHASPGEFVDSFMKAAARSKRGRVTSPDAAQQDDVNMSVASGYARWNRSHGGASALDVSLFGGQSAISAAASSYATVPAARTAQAGRLADANSSAGPRSVKTIRLPSRLEQALSLHADDAVVSNMRADTANDDAPHAGAKSRPAAVPASAPPPPPADAASDSGDSDSIPDLPPSAGIRVGSLSDIMRQYEERVRRLLGDDAALPAEKIEGKATTIPSKAQSAVVPASQSMSPPVQVRAVKHETVSRVQPRPVITDAPVLPIWVPELRGSVAVPPVTEASEADILERAAVSFHHLQPTTRFEGGKALDFASPVEIQESASHPREEATTYAYVPRQPAFAHRYDVALSTGVSLAAVAALAPERRDGGAASAARTPTQPEAAPAAAMEPGTWTSQTLAFITPTGTPTRKANEARAAVERAAADPVVQQQAKPSKLRWFGVHPGATAAQLVPAATTSTAATGSPSSPPLTAVTRNLATSFVSPPNDGAQPPSMRSGTWLSSVAADAVASLRMADADAPVARMHSGAAETQRVLDFDDGASFEPTPLPRGFGTSKRQLPVPTSR